MKRDQLVSRSGLCVRLRAGAEFDGAGLKRSVLHKEANDEVPRYWLSAPQRALPDKDWVLRCR